MTFHPGRPDEHAQVLKLAAESDTAVQRTVNEAKRVTALVENQILPQANASEAPVPSAEAAPSGARRLARADSSEKSYAGSNSTTSNDSESGPDIESTTKYAKDGTPTVSINGRQIPTFTAFSNVQPAPQNAPLFSLGDSQSSGGSTRAAAADRGAASSRSSENSESRTDVQSPSNGNRQQNRAMANTTGGATAGASSGSGSGRSSDANSPSTLSASAPSRSIAPTSTSAGAGPSETAGQPEIKTQKDALDTLKQAKDPKQLLKQPWFVKHLEDLQLQIVVDGAWYGSKSPKKRLNLKAFIQESAP